MAPHANGWRLRRSAELRRAALVSRICATTATMLGDADAPPSFDMSRFLTCTDGISQAARLSGRICDRDESMTLLRSAPAQSPHGRTRGDRIQPVSVRHLIRRPRQPNASRLLRNTRRIERSRFRFADGRLDRSGLSAAGNSYRNVASTRTSDHLATFGAGTIALCCRRRPAARRRACFGAPRRYFRLRQIPVFPRLQRRPAAATTGSRTHEFQHQCEYACVRL